MKTSGEYKIRPAGRHILTIGRDLIQDSYAAVVEIVKNSFDADASEVLIEFNGFTDKKEYTIVIQDTGHGMSHEVVINKWMVPSTEDKLKRKTSPNGRVMQGKKGVGRYAASILGEDLLLETVEECGKRTIAYLDWKDFENADYLDDVEILIETESINSTSGTRLTIMGGEERYIEWNKNQFNKLRFELKKLMPPSNIAEDEEPQNSDFSIRLSVVGFEGVEPIDEVIEPYPIADLFDYKISGKLNSKGKGKLNYSSQKTKSTSDESIEFDAEIIGTGCGEIEFNIMVYDREKEAIEALIKRGLKDEHGKYLGKLEAKQLLNVNNGVGVYRNGFRIRPLGDPDFDWLKLNEQRIQNPSLRIGSNQVIGFVHIQSEESSNLIEKSARDGLKENESFDVLKKVTSKVIQELENRRFQFRRALSLSNPKAKIERELKKIFSVDNVKNNISRKLRKSGVRTDVLSEVLQIIERDANEKNAAAEDIRQTVAIYQGQATLGKIINVILHEGRRPLNFFKNQVPNIEYWHEEYVKSPTPEILSKIIPIALNLGDNADIFARLFSRLDPLAAGKRGAKVSVPFSEALQGVFSVFEEEMVSQNVKINITGPDDFMFIGWVQDLYAIFTNLIDNSLYWMEEKNISNREINIDFSIDGKQIQYIDYRDTGPGISPSLLIADLIFEPEFTTKNEGTGLGLAIAGESAARNGLDLKVFDSKLGAYFRMQPKLDGSNADI